MYFPPCPSPPPPLPSPVLLPTPLPSPPPMAKKPTPRRTSSHRTPRSPRAHADPSPHRTIKRTFSYLPSRCRSPPPSPAIPSPPPPVPPIPAFVLIRNHSFVRPSVPNRSPASDLYLDHSSKDPPNMRCESQPGGPLTCMRFLAAHNPKGHCQA
ncbi:hypothetical protein L210DRAFT_976535 [Boletus edulis BED1]|uniref:Uncharacterized protein n=1 Tax=Boletus edulis BED1 TaxID=1328754 RepID=A0AAD4C7B0_BOLED|nr:hypothetical protein L210DRAFT_976535 [Boletus edulis BED1]